MKKIGLLLLLTTLISAQNLTVITTLFPLYDFAKIIAGDEATVSLLLPAGVEPHAFEPTPKDIVKISKTSIFIYTLPSMEPWVEDIISTSSAKNLTIVEAGKGIHLLGDNHKHKEHIKEHIKEQTKEQTDECKHAEDGDPHIWLDPVRAIKIVENIIVAFEKAAPNNLNFRARGDSLKAELELLNLDIGTKLSSYKNRTIVSGGHFAFRYFTQRYNLKHISPFSNFSPNAEPSPKAVATVIQTIRKENYTTIFFEELVNSRVAETIARESGAKLLLLHGAHNVSANELKSEIDYIKIMRGNLERIAKGLEN